MIVWSFPSSIVRRFSNLFGMQLCELNYLEGVQGFSLALLHRTFAWTKDEIEVCEARSEQVDVAPEAVTDMPLLGVSCQCSQGLAGSKRPRVSQSVCRLPYPSRSV